MLFGFSFRHSPNASDFFAVLTPRVYLEAVFVPAALFSYHSLLLLLLFSPTALLLLLLSSPRTTLLSCSLATALLSYCSSLPAALF